MYIRMGSRGVAPALILLGGILVPIVARAQAGSYVTPSFSVARVYDDNLFSTSSQREKDFISRLSPEIQAGYQSARLTLLGRYTFDTEVFADHPELTTAQARQQASTEFQYLPTRLLTLAFDSEYLDTQTPGEFNATTGLEVGRARAQRFSLSPSIAYRFDPLTAGTGGYVFTKDELAGGVLAETHTTDLGLDRRITPRDTGSFSYTFRQFAFGGGDTTRPFRSGDTIASSAFTLGWTREVTPLTSFTLRGGPRFSEGLVDPEVSASIRHRLKRGEVSFTYARSQTTVIGRTGTLDTESFAAAVTYQPLRFLQVSAAPSFFKSTNATFKAKVYRVNLGATYQITKWLSLVGSYEFSLQQGGLGRLRNEEISHNLFLLRLVATNPFRLY